MNDTPGYVYFMREHRTENSATDLIKIGWSVDVATRRAVLQGERGVPIDILALFCGTTTEEGKLHALFSPFRVDGEWFRPCEQLLRIVESGQLPPLPAVGRTAPFPRETNSFYARGARTGQNRDITVLQQTRYIKIVQKLCLQCGKTFERALHAKYCSNRCVNNASYARHAEEMREKQRAKYAAKKNK